MNKRILKLAFLPVLFFSSCLTDLYSLLDHFSFSPLEPVNLVKQVSLGELPMLEKYAYESKIEYRISGLTPGQLYSIVWSPVSASGLIMACDSPCANTAATPFLNIHRMSNTAFLLRPVDDTVYFYIKTGAPAWPFGNSSYVESVYLLDVHPYRSSEVYDMIMLSQNELPLNRKTGQYLDVLLYDLVPGQKYDVNFVDIATNTLRDTYSFGATSSRSDFHRNFPISGDTFRIKIAPAAGPVSWDAPGLSFSSADLPLLGSAVANRKSYFLFNGTIWQPYTSLVFTPVFDIFHVYFRGENGLDNRVCNDRYFFVACMFTNNTIGVTSEQSFDFTISEIGARSPEGAVLAPLVVGALPYSGTVDNSYSYYQVTGLTPSTMYHVSLTQATGPLSFSVFSAADFSGTPLAEGSSGSYLGNRSANVISGAGVDLFVRVNGSSEQAGAEFVLNVQLLPVNEGSVATPQVLAFGVDLPWSGQVASGLIGNSYYHISGLTPGNTYRVYLYNLTSDADLVLFGDDAAFLSASGLSYVNHTVTDYADYTATSGDLYLRVDRFSENGAFFYLDVKDITPP